MRASTRTILSCLTPVYMGALCFAVAGCDADSGGGPGDTTTTGDTTTETQTDPQPQCAAVVANDDSIFTRTTGPDIARFRFVAATKDAVLASTGTSVHRSLDEGATWALVDFAPFRGAYVQAMASLGDEIFVSVGTMEEQGVFRSTDGGATWTSASTAELTMPSYLTSDGTSLFAQQFGQTYRWDGAAETWLALPTSDNGFDVIESDGTYLYGNGMYLPGVYRLELGNASAVWTPIADLPQWGYKAFAFDGKQGFAANSTQVFRSVDGGSSWTPLDGSAVDINDLLFADGHLFAATHDELLVSDDGGMMWTPAPGEYYSAPFSLAASDEFVFAAGGAIRRATPTDLSKWEALHPLGDFVYGLHATRSAVLALSDHRLFRTSDLGATWSEVLMDGAPLDLSLESVVVRKGEKGDIVFALRAQPDNSVQVLASTDDGESFHVQGVAPQGNWINFLSDTGSGLVLGISTGAGYDCADVQDVTTRLYRSKDDGKTWEDALNTFPITFTDCYDYDYTPGLTGVGECMGTFFATSFWTGTYRSADGGDSWQHIDTPESIGAVSSVTAAGGDMIAIAGAGGVARSTDGGVTWKASGLDGLAVASLAVVDDILFATVPAADPVDAGVYTSTDLGETWARVDADFNARVQDIAIQNDYLIVGTLDESVWTAPLACPQK